MKANIKSIVNAALSSVAYKRGLIYYPNIFLKSVIYVNPNKIKYKVKSPLLSKKWKRYFIKGDWDLNVVDIDTFVKNNVKFKTLIELLEYNISPDKTSEYKWLAHKLNKHGAVDGMKSRGDLLCYIKNVEKMYYTIIKEGRLRTQVELGLSPYIGEINCYLDRNGNILKATGGTHRFAIAKYINVKKIPVQISMMHYSNYLKIINMYGKCNYEAINKYLINIQENNN